MPTIKIPLTGEKKVVPEWTKYIAMDADGEWYAFKKKPIVQSTMWANDLNYRELLIKENSSLTAKTPELLPLLNWKQSLFTIEEVLWP